MGIVVIRIAVDFSRTPGARKPEEGPYPGVDFRDKILYPKLLEAIKMIINCLSIWMGRQDMALLF